MEQQLWLHAIQGGVTILVFAAYLYYRLRQKEKPVAGIKAFLPRDFVDVIALLLLVPRLVEHYLDIIKKIGG